MFLMRLKLLDLELGHITLSLKFGYWEYSNYELSQLKFNKGKKETKSANIKPKTKA